MVESFFGAVQRKNSKSQYGEYAWLPGWIEGTLTEGMRVWRDTDGDVLTLAISSEPFRHSDGAGELKIRKWCRGFARSNGGGLIGAYVVNNGIKFIFSATGRAAFARVRVVSESPFPVRGGGLFLCVRWGGVGGRVMRVMGEPMRTRGMSSFVSCITHDVRVSPRIRN
jgi:hypothetical protein